ncbi:maleylpyruvate isomerase family mycothiol-dependent enzyme [Sphaerisporangium rufum]|uniref:maleylpyruvate isomerase family mycothiol-dependent enzyme n=1 Tax=Sphaerisporangium rufum TaxID=1381558 RepID=UPI0019527AD2|nr:maleylpyruvate isomerase family mycothiol-dependent enzyme [Sphaerisporangium rufum]
MDRQPRSGAGIPGPSDPITRLAVDAAAERLGPPPAAARSRLLAAARAARRPAGAAGHPAPYAARVAAMDALLASAAPADLSRRIVEGWTLTELVAHLAAVDGLVAAALGTPVAGPPPGADDPIARTAELHAHIRDLPADRVRAEWLDQAAALAERAAATDPGTPVTASGMTLPLADHLLARALETWIHTADAAAVLGLALPRPITEHIRPTADLCARLVPVTMALSGLAAPGRTLRLTLTGDGGGTWHLPLAPQEPAEPPAGTPADTEISCDAVAFCFLLGGRGSPDAFPADVHGDHALARDILHAAPALSGP